MQSRQGELFPRPTDPEPWEIDERRDRLVASIAFPVAPFGPYDYLVPEALRDRVEPGRRVRVPLGKGERTLVGYCVGVSPGGADPRVLKEVSQVVDAQPLLAPDLLALAQWIASYYLCELGPVLETVVPAGVRTQAGTREQTFFRLADDLAARLSERRLTPKQHAIVEAARAAPQALTMSELAEAAGCTSGPIQRLRAMGFLVGEVQRVATVTAGDVVVAPESPLVLNHQQQGAFDTILAALDANRAESILVHGVTGSGKTEVYIRAIEEVTRRGRQAIVLVPEISLTPQTCQRFRARFPQVAVLHSHQTDVERHAQWRRIARGDVQVIVGARSAVFAPTRRLGLIVIDEEHDASFKQDSQPRYHARDVAWQRCLQANIPLVLGSATPALETWQRAQQGVLRLVEMPARVSQLPLPAVTTVDLRSEQRRGGSRGAISRPLQQAIQDALRQGGQVIILLNRRGFATSIQCPACGYVARCPDCDLALTHHRSAAVAACHYCDYQIPAPTACPQCRFEGIRFGGLGTERLEEELHDRFPQTPLLRMDSDTMRKPGSHEQALARFRSGEVKILVGTQMIAKGLDFPNVTLVGVVNADTALHFPDFRAAERTFQLVTQVAGRTGRGRQGGHVIVQTFSPEHPAIVAATRHDYHQFAAGELPQREQYGYPPFGTLIRVIVRSESAAAAEASAESWGERIREVLVQRGVDGRVLGPAPCPIARLRGRSRWHLLVLAADGATLRDAIRDVARGLVVPRNVQWLIDVDPLEML